MPVNFGSTKNVIITKSASLCKRGFRVKTSVD